MSASFAKPAKPARPDSATLVRQMDATLQEFDRQMEIVLAEIACHAGLARDYDTLVSRQQQAREAGAAFVFEAAAALLDARKGMAA
jgi:hypothetical protein